MNKCFRSGIDCLIAYGRESGDAGNIQNVRPGLLFEVGQQLPGQQGSGLHIDLNNVIEIINWGFLKPFGSPDTCIVDQNGNIKMRVQPISKGQYILIG